MDWNGIKAKFSFKYNNNKKIQKNKKNFKKIDNFIDGSNTTNQFADTIINNGLSESQTKDMIVKTLEREWPAKSEEFMNLLMKALLDYKEEQRDDVLKKAVKSIHPIFLIANYSDELGEKQLKSFLGNSKTSRKKREIMLLQQMSKEDYALAKLMFRISRFISWLTVKAHDMKDDPLDVLKQKLPIWECNPKWKSEEEARKETLEHLEEEWVITEIERQVQDIEEILNVFIGHGDEQSKMPSKSNEYLSGLGIISETNYVIDLKEKIALCFPYSLIPNEFKKYETEIISPLSKTRIWEEKFLAGIEGSKFEVRLETIFEKLTKILIYTSSINKTNLRIHKSMNFFWEWNGLFNFPINEIY